VALQPAKIFWNKDQATDFRLYGVTLDIVSAFQSVDVDHLTRIAPVRARRTVDQFMKQIRHRYVGALPLHQLRGGA
jgi:hypothetical protein